MSPSDAPDLVPDDLTRPQTEALKAISAHPAFRVKGRAYRARGFASRILPATAAYLLDLHLVEMRTARNGTPYLTATDRGRALVQAPAAPATRLPRSFFEPREAPILDADVDDDPFSEV